MTPREESRRRTPATALRPAREPNTIVLVVRGPISRGDIAPLCEHAHGLLEAGDRDLVCDVGSVVDPDVVTIDALARLQLIATGLGRRIRLRHASAELQELLRLAGLYDVVPPLRS